jgi:hypothetical protein
MPGRDASASNARLPRCADARQVVRATPCIIGGRAFSPYESRDPSLHEVVKGAGPNTHRFAWSWGGWGSNPRPTDYESAALTG